MLPKVILTTATTLGLVGDTNMANIDLQVVIMGQLQVVIMGQLQVVIMGQL
jgi:hypothetical protein